MALSPTSKVKGFRKESIAHIFSNITSITSVLTSLPVRKKRCSTLITVKEQDDLTLNKAWWDLQEWQLAGKNNSYSFRGYNNFAIFLTISGFDARGV